MKKFNLTMFCLLCFVFSHQNVLSQKPAEISISVSPGITAVNFEKALGIADKWMLDWNQFFVSVDGKVFFPSKGNFQLGAQASWNKLYYAYYEFEYTPNNYFTYEYDVYTTSFMVLGRFGQRNFFTTVGAGVHIFEAGTVPAISFEFGYNLKLSESLYMPLSSRIMPIFDDGTPVPISASLGFAYRF